MQIIRRSTLALLLALLFCVPFAYGQGVQTKQPPVPTWIAWQVFQDSLVFYDKKDAQSTRKMLKDRLGLSPAQAATLLSRGNSFLAALKKIDADARAEVRKRYAGQALLANPERKQKVQKTIHQRAVEDGLDAEIQKQRQDAYTKHRDALVQEFGMLKYTQINGFVVKLVLPQIKQLPQVDPKLVAAARPAVLRPNAARPTIVPPQLPQRGK